MSIVVVPFGVAIVFEDTKLLRSGDLMLSLLAASSALVCWCDVAAVMEGFRSKHSQWVRGSLDWVVWIVAISLTCWEVRPDIVLTTLAHAALVVLFDVDLIMHVAKGQRAWPAPVGER